MTKRLKIILCTLMCLGMNSPSFAGDMIQVKGSDTLINVVQKLAEEYMKKNPDKMISVTGGGSGTGVAALVNKKCDIANASRLMKPKELEMAASRGVNPIRVVIALDSLSIIVGPDNPVQSLTVEQVGKIYKGEITNWQDVGGNDMKISLYGRQSNSGTYDFMIEDVMKGDYSFSMKQMNGNAQIVEGVKADPSAIGYVGVGYAKSAEGIKVLPIANKMGGTPISPLNSADVKSGKYPITRPLNQYVGGGLTPNTKAFIEYELSSEGQAIVEEEGFFEVPKEYLDFNKSAGL